MNYYRRHLGDYARQTAHLSLAEHGAYTLLLDLYYAREEPLPTDRGVLYRLMRARSAADRKVVDTVLTEFFTEQPDGWHKGRCDEEIAKAQDKTAKAKDSAGKRWHGKQDANVMRTHTEGNTSQEPVAISHKPEKRGDAARGTRFALDALPDDWKEYCRQNRPDLDPQKVFENFSDYWKAKAGKDATKRDWSATWRTWVRNEKSQSVSRGTPTIAWWATEAGIIDKGRELGLTARPGEDMQQFKGRINSEIERRKREAA